ncbi:hypothetical protein FIBSPDRAFT_949383 [Athelia psychrophila]|uniref:Uncharacterized protein n=1 Tax=Athelia psychrophila TaxID=1759441 RepID=A0A166PW89_9AGAM|nr:hypothetical protein FIBSPDRAFT_949383 [Fibularhizoctonia sp. CBS 109695]
MMRERYVDKAQGPQQIIKQARQLLKSAEEDDPSSSPPLVVVALLRIPTSEPSSAGITTSQHLITRNQMVALAFPLPEADNYMTRASDDLSTPNREDIPTPVARMPAMESLSAFTAAAGERVQETDLKKLADTIVGAGFTSTSMHAINAEQRPGRSNDPHFARVFVDIH